MRAPKRPREGARNLTAVIRAEKDRASIRLDPHFADALREYVIGKRDRAKDGLGLKPPHSGRLFGDAGAIYRHGSGRYVALESADRTDTRALTGDDIRAVWTGSTVARACDRRPTQWQVLRAVLRWPWGQRGPENPLGTDVAGQPSHRSEWGAPEVPNPIPPRAS